MERMQSQSTGGAEPRVRIVGYCASCRHFRRYLAERPVPGLARFGACKLGVVPVTARVSGNGGCHRYQPDPKITGRAR